MSSDHNDTDSAATNYSSRKSRGRNSTRSKKRLRTDDDSSSSSDDDNNLPMLYAKANTFAVFCTQQPRHPPYRETASSSEMTSTTTNTPPPTTTTFWLAQFISDVSLAQYQQRLVNKTTSSLPVMLYAWNGDTTKKFFVPQQKISILLGEILMRVCVLPDLAGTAFSIHKSSLLKVINAA